MSSQIIIGDKNIKIRENLLDREVQISYSAGSGNAEINFKNGQEPVKFLDPVDLDTLIHALTAMKTVADNKAARTR